MTQITIRCDLSGDGTWATGQLTIYPPRSGGTVEVERTVAFDGSSAVPTLTVTGGLLHWVREQLTVRLNAPLWWFTADPAAGLTQNLSDLHTAWEATQPSGPPPAIPPYIATLTSVDNSVRLTRAGPTVATSSACR